MDEQEMIEAMLKTFDLALIDRPEMKMKAAATQAMRTAYFVAREAIRDEVLEEAAVVATHAHLLPPDGGSPTEEECNLAATTAEQKYKVECLPHRDAGGQHVGTSPQTIMVTHEGTKQFVGVSTVGRSQHQAKELAITLLDIILEDIC